MPRLKELAGNRFGKLTVIKRAEDYITSSGRHYVQWICKCDCGSLTVVVADALVRRKTQLCGCFRKESASAKSSTHRESKTHLYGVWCAIKRRCYNSNTAHYIDYGGRGIIVCDEWKRSYEAFKNWAYNSGYDDGLSIDRIDVDGYYEPSNCRWVDSVAQANNRRSNRQYSYNGETHNIMEWSKIIGIPYKTLYNRLYVGWDIKRALTT